jgi:two-component system, cell cycle sensor histidine kinase and response regulator CckA
LPNYREATIPLRTVLLVEDADLLRKLLYDFMKSIDIEVLEASCAEEATHISDSYDGTIDLLFADIGLGREVRWECAIAIAKQRPHCRVLFMSGAMDRLEWETHSKPKGSYFIQKPFQLVELREILQTIFGEQTGGRLQGKENSADAGNGWTVR